MLGLHAGMNYDNSRSAIGVSLGTLFFLFIGIATCMRVMVAFSGSFHMQLQPFLAFMGGGTLGALRRPGCPQPVAGDSRRFATLPGGHVLRHYQLPAGPHAGAVSGRAVHLWFCHRRHAGPGHFRVRRRHRPHNARRGLSRRPARLRPTVDRPVGHEPAAAHPGPAPSAGGGPLDQITTISYDGPVPATPVPPVWADGIRLPCRFTPGLSS